jgi:fructan beta-fructosidase
MNDPNGLVFHDGEYHLFYQHYPDSTVWGPMHWGHAVSSDLVHWEHLPIALYPDSLGYIFSGSAVVDTKNTSGFGTVENPPLVAIYTYHDAEKEKTGSIEFQTQGIAFSLDNGRSWTKYEKNPVLENPGIRDFRDPKVFWHESTNKWVMILAVLDHVELYASPDLRSWTKLSEFGKGFGAHGGVWECPDLFPLVVEGKSKQKWVMLVSINPGGPNVGSATQYFIGEFDGRNFKPDSNNSEANWIDWGQDNYAGVTYANTPNNRRIFVGWMNNWAYAQIVPTEKWRGAASLARELSLVDIDGRVVIRSMVIPELLNSSTDTVVFTDVAVKDSLNLATKVKYPLTISIIQGVVEAKTFSIEFANKKNQKLSTGYDLKTNRFFVDRSTAGRNDFSKDFHGIVWADRYAGTDSVAFTIVMDIGSIEVYFDDGLTSMTNLYFADGGMETLKLRAGGEAVHVRKLEVRRLSSVWNK